jgi:hypothetical protein
MTFDMGADSTAKPVFPALPFGEWKSTKETLHRYAQITGKVRLGCCAPLNHWWNVTLQVSSRGLSTGPNPYGGLTFEVDFDFVTHKLKVSTSEAVLSRSPWRTGCPWRTSTRSSSRAWRPSA